MPVRIPGKAVGNSTMVAVWVFVAPMPMAASFIFAGTMRIASSAVNMIVGNIRMETATAPAIAEKPPEAKTTTP